jgi:hypothetical protein
VLYTIQPVKPYAGLFYRRIFIEDNGDQNDAGSAPEGSCWPDKGPISELALSMTCA